MALRAIVLVLAFLAGLAPMVRAETPDASSHSIAVFDLANGGDYRKAIQLHEQHFATLRSELTKNPHYTHAVGVSYKALGDWARALEFYEFSLQADTEVYTRPILLEAIAEAQLQLGRLDEAETNYKTAFEQRLKTVNDPDDFNAVRINAGLSRVALKRGDWGAALKGLQQNADRYEKYEWQGIKGNPIADQLYNERFENTRWMYEGIAKAAWELSKASGGDQAALRAAGFDAVQWLQRSTASEALAQTMVRISAGESGGDGELRHVQDLRQLYKDASDDNSNGRSLQQYRQRLVSFPQFQAEHHHAKQEYESLSSAYTKLRDSEADRQRQASDSAQDIASEYTRLSCRMMDPRPACKRLVEQATAGPAQGAAPPPQVDALDMELRRQAVDEAKRKLDELDRVVAQDTDFYLWLERQIIPQLEGSDAASLKKFEREMTAIIGAGDPEAHAANDMTKFEDLTDREPLKEAQVMSLLDGSKAVVTFLVGEQESFVWAITSQGGSWASIAISRVELEKKLAILRCGLDGTKWRGDQDFVRRCLSVLGMRRAPEDGEPLPFSFATAHDLYTLLLGPVAKEIAGKQLIIVPSGALVGLPFQALMSSRPGKAVGTAHSDYVGIDWLGRRHVLSIVPSVPVLKLLLRVAAQGRAPDRYIGFGNPDLKGDGTCPEVAEVDGPALCPNHGAGRSGDGTRSTGGKPRVRATSRSPGLDDVFKSQAATSPEVLEAVRRLCPLPETAAELTCVAQSLGVPESQLKLSTAATEAELKALSAGGSLASYQLVHFATHGLLSGDVKDMTGRRAEPALVLSPPLTPTGEGDDGLLTTSEIVKLKLNADLIILSACNTAAGQDLKADSLSGLARAFFFAGTRSLMVSHWPVYSDVAARLVSEAVRSVEQGGQKVGYAEAMAKATRALMDDASDPENAHPATWAPFVLVGSG